MSYILAVAHQTSPYITLYNEGKKRAYFLPSVLPTGTAQGCAFSPDGSKLAVAHQNSPFITIYNTSDWSKVANPGVLPTGTAQGCAFSPDGSKLAVAHQNSPFITIYNTSDWSKVANPSVLPAGIGYGCAFGAWDNFVIRGSVRDIDNNPAARKVRVFERSSGDLCGGTTSNPVTGDYELNVYEGDVDYDVQFMAATGELLNDLFFARVRAGAP